MNTAKAGFLILFVLAFIGFYNVSFAGVHDGSVGDCDYCHTMHGGHRYLLSGSDPSSTCLKCHAFFPFGQIVKVIAMNGTFDIQLTPAGDFLWLKVQAPNETMLTRDRHGHNIIAADFGFYADASSATAPGGDYLADKLSCISCHDTHGSYGRIDNIGTKGITTKGKTKIPVVASGTTGFPATEDAPVGVYRLLAGSGYQIEGSPAFLNPPPDAVATPDDINIFVAYGRDMSEWCANCHPRFLQNSYISGARGQMHPAGNGAFLKGVIVDNYINNERNAGNNLSTYSPAVPVEEGTADYELLVLHAYTRGRTYTVNSSAQVMCLTCHYAHAGPGSYALRWHYHLNPVEKPADAEKYFRSPVCNKCHAKD